jgi:hypothetical protein
MATRAILIGYCAAGLLAAGVAACAPLQSSFADAPAANPTGGGASVRLEPVAQASAQRSPRPVYVCRDAIPVVFSDRPCGSIVEQRALDVVQPAPGQAATIMRAAPPASTKPRALPAGDDLRPTQRADRCKRLWDQLEKLDDRMRSGYSAREAARLWNRWREAKAHIREARC